MFLAPTALSEENRMIIKGVEEYLEEKGISYINFNGLTDELGIDYNRDFTDNTHLNTYGANKVTSYFGEYLTEQFTFEDHRGDADYYLWDQCSEYINHKAWQEELKSITDAESYLAKLAEGEDISVILSLDGNYQDSTLDLASYTSIFGIPETEYYIGGKWIYENGQVIYYMNSAATDEYLYNLSDKDTLRLTNGPDVLARVGINGASVNSIFNGLSVVVYDKYTKEIIDKKGFF